MDIIDPTLETSVKREEMDEKTFRSAFWQITILIVIAFIIWVIYSTFASRLDTRPENNIDINPDLLTPSTNNSGRRTPISETL